MNRFIVLGFLLEEGIFKIYKNAEIKQIAL